MKKNIVLRCFALLGFASLLAACVTINIYFPAAAADKAADKIIDDVWQLKNGQNKDSAPKEGAPAEPAPEPAPTPAPEAK